METRVCLRPNLDALFPASRDVTTGTEGAREGENFNGKVVGKTTEVKEESSREELELKGSFMILYFAGSLWLQAGFG